MEPVCCRNLLNAMAILALRADQEPPGEDFVLLNCHSLTGRVTARANAGTHSLPLQNFEGDDETENEESATALAQLWAAQYDVVV